MSGAASGVLPGIPAVTAAAAANNRLADHKSHCVPGAVSVALVAQSSYAPAAFVEILAAPTVCAVDDGVLSTRVDSGAAEVLSRADGCPLLVINVRPQIRSQESVTILGKEVQPLIRQFVQSIIFAYSDYS